VNRSTFLRELMAKAWFIFRNRSMLQSPIRRSLRGAHGETRARELGYLTSMMGR